MPHTSLFISSAVGQIIAAYGGVVAISMGAKLVFFPGFVPHMDRLLNEDILVGSGWSARETLRPLAYSTLADVTHQVKNQLTLSQVSRCGCER